MELSVTEIGRRIHTVRGYKVMLDNELAELYETETKLLNKAVARNPKSFPADFVFQLVKDEFEPLRFQIGTLKSGRGQHRKYLPNVFTEQGVAMLSSVLQNDRATEVNIAIMRTFVQIRQVSEINLDLVKKLDQLERKQDDQHKIIFDAIRYLTELSRAREVSTPLIPADRLTTPSHLERKSAALSFTVWEGKTELKDPSNRKTHPISVDTIQLSVAKYFGIKIQDLKMINRTRSIVMPRQIAIYLIRKFMGISLSEIGQFFGGKDHSTILHAFRKVTAAIEKDEKIRAAVQTISKDFFCF